MSGKNALLIRANAKIRRSRPLEESGWEYEIRNQVVRYPTECGRIFDLTFIYFRSSGCRFDRQGECTMCNYGIAERVDADRAVHFVQKALKESQHYEALHISPFGNMFDTHEVPSEARRRIFELAAATDCEYFSCETRPETLTEESLAEFTAILREKSRWINIGLESSDPWIQYNCVGKSLTPEAFCAGTELLQRHGVHAIANALLGSPFLTEREALESTIRSVRWALEHGAHLCLLFPSNVKRWTLLHWLWERGLYSSPSLWSLVEVIYALGPELTQRVGLSWYAAPLSNFITDIPYTCERCHSAVVETLHEYKARPDFSLIESLRGSTCSCRTEWKARLLTPVSLPLYERVAELYQRIASELLGLSWWKANEEGVLQQLSEGYDPTFLEQSEVLSLV